MTVTVIIIISILVFCALLMGLVSATPMAPLDEQAKAIRENQEAKEARKRMREIKRQRRRQRKK